jgi:hypothetical protein
LSILEHPYQKKVWALRSLRLCPGIEKNQKSNKILWDLIEEHDIYDLLPDHLLPKDKKEQVAQVQKFGKPVVPRKKLFPARKSA